MHLCNVEQGKELVVLNDIWGMMGPILFFTFRVAKGVIIMYNGFQQASKRRTSEGQTLE